MANVEKFKYWCNKILPLVYDDSLSYYEFLGKVYEKLNETIDAVNSNTEAVAEFDQRINDFIAAETAAREGWEDQQERDRQSWETAETANRDAWENQQALKWSAFQAMFISEYDPDDAYVKGDLCSVQYKMYVANASTTGTFDPTKWDEIILSDYLAKYVSTAAAAMQSQYDSFLANYQRSFGVEDHFTSSTTDAASVRLLYDNVVGIDKAIPNGYGDIANGFYLSSGSWSANADFHSGNLIPCKAGDVLYRYKRDTDRWVFGYSNVTFWTAAGVYVSGIYTAADATSVTVPNNATIAFVRVPISVSTINSNTYAAITFEQTTTAPPYWYDVHNEAARRQAAIKAILADHFTNSEDQTLTNKMIYSLLVGVDKEIPGGYGDITGHYYSSRGTFTALENFNTGNLIPCKAGDVLYKYLRTTGHWNWMGTHVTFWTASGNYVTGIYVSTSAETITVPALSEIAFARVPYNNTQINPAICFEKTINEPPFWYDPHNILGTLNQQIDKISPTQWKNKTWYAYGTSITSTAQGHYVTPLASMLGATAVNKGIPGGGIGNLGAGSTGQVYTAICNVTDGKLAADLITLETGANDVNANVPLGTIYDTGTTTLAGCLNDCIRYLQTNTAAQIVIIESPTSNTPAPQEANQVWKWRLMMRDICKINCVPFIPNESNIGYAKMNSNQGSDYLVDNIHQTTLGGYVYAEAIFKYLKNVPTFKTSLPG